MTVRTIWQEMNACPEGGTFVVIFDGEIALVDDGEHIWIANAEQLRGTIKWSGLTPADDHIAHEAYAYFWGRCPGWIVEDLREADEFPLDIPDCVQALHRNGFEDLIPAFWDRDEEAF